MAEQVMDREAGQETQHARRKNASWLEFIRAWEKSESVEEAAQKLSEITGVEYDVDTVKSRASTIRNNPDPAKRFNLKSFPPKKRGRTLDYNELRKQLEAEGITEKAAQDIANKQEQQDKEEAKA